MHALNKINSILMMLFFLCEPSFAIEALQHRLIKYYPQLKATALDGCETCHTPAVTGFLNPYAVDLKKHFYRFADIEYLDSDQDGISNFSEIQKRSNPGSQATIEDVMHFWADKENKVDPTKSVWGLVRFTHKKHLDYLPQYGVLEGCLKCHNTTLYSHFEKKHNDVHVFDSYVASKKHSICFTCHIQLKVKSRIDWRGQEAKYDSCDYCHDFSVYFPNGFPPPLVLPPAPR